MAENTSKVFPQESFWRLLGRIHTLAFPHRPPTILGSQPLAQVPLPSMSSDCCPDLRLHPGRRSLGCAPSLRPCPHPTQRPENQGAEVQWREKMDGPCPGTLMTRTPPAEPVCRGREAPGRCWGPAAHAFGVVMGDPRLGHPARPPTSARNRRRGVGLAPWGLCSPRRLPAADGALLGGPQPWAWAGPCHVQRWPYGAGAHGMHQAPGGWGG